MHTNFRFITKIASLSVLALLLAGCGGKGKPEAAPPAKVSVEVLGHTDTYGTAAGSFSGTTESGTTATVSFNVPGTIDAVYVSAGQHVTAGQRLAEVGSGNLCDADNIAQAELAQARDAYNRLRSLHEANALPDMQWVQVQQKLRQAENAASIARRGVSDAVIHAPIAGMVSEKFVDRGQNVVPSQPVFTIVDLDDMQIAISVPEEEIASFGEESTAEVSFEALGDLSVRGTLAEKGVVADPLTRTYKVKFAISNADGRILPGMIGSVRVDGVSPAPDAAAEFTLPSQAVLLDADNRRFVWVVSGGRAERRYVTAEELSTDGVSVRGGLAEGDSVIVAGMQKVSTGSAVVVE